MADKGPWTWGTWLRGGRVTGLLFVLLGAVAAIEAVRELPLGTLGQPGPAYAPVLISSLLAVLGLSMTWTGGSSLDLTASDWSGLPHALRVVGGIIFAALALERLGYRLTALALLLFYLGVAERRPLLPTLAWSLGLAFGTHFLFVRLLKVPLPVGPFGF
jgi:putative tricarboxylic transport membrane protein